MSSEMIDRRVLLAGLGLAGVASLARRAEAGPIDPPPGPVGPTGWTTQEIYDRIARGEAGIAEPRIPIQSLPGSSTAVHVISQPGSYYLTGDVLGVAGKHGIEVATSDASIDLRGFSIRGAEGSLNGVNAGGYSRTRLVNGSVVGWGGTGVVLGFDALADGVQSTGNGERGIRTSSGVLSRCTAHGNADIGFLCAATTLLSCQSSQNGSAGFLGSFGCALRECTAEQNGTGFVVEQDSVATTCLAKDSAAEGFLVRVRSRALECESYGGGDGFIVSDAACDRCHAFGASSRGIYCGDAQRALVIRCVASRNGTNFLFGTGNSFGPIVNGAGVGDLSAIPASSHPLANIIY